MTRLNARTSFHYSVHVVGSPFTTCKYIYTLVVTRFSYRMLFVYLYPQKICLTYIYVYTYTHTYKWWNCEPQGKNVWYLIWKATGMIPLYFVLDTRFHLFKFSAFFTRIQWCLVYIYNDKQNEERKKKKNQDRA